MNRSKRRIKWSALEISDSERRAILDGYYNDIQKRMAKFPIDLFPTSLLIEIFKRVPVDEIRKLRLVCRSWYSICVAAVEKLPKPRVDWLELKVSCVKSDDVKKKENSELALMHGKRHDLLWTFSDFTRIFNDIRMSQLIFCGSLIFTWNTPVSQYLPSLLTLKGHAQFRPNSLIFDRSDMTNVTEQQLTDCVSCFKHSLQLLELHNLHNACLISDTTPANLLSILSQVIIDINLLIDASEAVSNALTRWLSSDPRSVTLHLSYVTHPKALDLKARLKSIAGEQLKWNSQVIGAMTHPDCVAQGTLEHTRKQFTDQYGQTHTDNSVFHLSAFRIALNDLRVSVKDEMYVNLSGFTFKPSSNLS